jgi:hypothetical protein
MRDESGNAHVITLAVLGHAMLAVFLWFAGNWAYDELMKLVG